MDTIGMKLLFSDGRYSLFRDAENLVITRDFHFVTMIDSPFSESFGEKCIRLCRQYLDKLEETL